MRHSTSKSRTIAFPGACVQWPTFSRIFVVLLVLAADALEGLLLHQREAGKRPPGAGRRRERGDRAPERRRRAGDAGRGAARGSGQRAEEGTWSQQGNDLHTGTVAVVERRGGPVEVGRRGGSVKGDTRDGGRVMGEFCGRAWGIVPRTQSFVATHKKIVLGGRHDTKFFMG